jgi:hypothetical protein
MFLYKAAVYMQHGLFLDIKLIIFIKLFSINNNRMISNLVVLHSWQDLSFSFVNDY